MAYLDPMRIALSGDQARAQQHVRTARVLAYQLLRLNAEGGADVGRRRAVMPDGTEIMVVQAGLDVSAQINAPAPAGPGEDVTMAYVCTAEATPRLLIVDVDRELVVSTLTGLGALIGLCAHPLQRRYLFGVNTIGQLIKLDLQEITAQAVTLDAPFTDMFISDDGEQLYLRFRATGTPGSGGVYGGLWTFATEDLSLISTYPDQFWSANTYRGDSHPAMPERLYLPVYGDGDLDGTPNTGHTSELNYIAEAVEVHDITGGPAIAGDTMQVYYIASSRGYRELKIDPAGERAYACSSRSDTWSPDGVPPLVDAPTVTAYDVAGGALTRIDQFLVGVSLNGSVGISHDGDRVFFPESNTEFCRVLERDEDGNYSEGTAFACRADASPDGTGRAAQLGPRGGSRPDNRMFFLSNASKTLWAFKPGSTTPDKQITFIPSPTIFTLNRARRMGSP